MYVSWRWISTWIDTRDVDPVAFASRFTCTVAEIDGVHRVGAGLEAVVVADVLAVEPHPQADKLRLATVDLGSRRERVVCGAPDLRVGMRVPFVPPGVRLPSGIEVRDGEVRGIRSPGMLASEADLGLSDDHAGLLSLDGCTAPAGTAFLDAVDAADVLYEVDNKSITHRPDLWGQYGMAREIAAMLDRPLAPLELGVALGHGDPVDVQVEAGLLCPRYLCARVEGVEVRPSPVRLRLLLRRLGVRPISNVVDATNLVMLETGNPLHAFDARFLRGGAIRVRTARPGEIIRTLDGVERHLEATDCVIADGEGPVALAGIMGGGDSEIRADTHTVVLEAAAFDAPAIRRTAMRLGLRTESSARFEKSLDPALPDVAARRFLRLLTELCPEARVASELVDRGPFRTRPPAAVRIQTTASYLRQRLGVDATELDDAWLQACLRRLEFGVGQHGDQLTVTVPTFRATRDVRIAEDLVEELGRHFGYQRVRSQPPLVAARPPHVPPLRRLERRVRNALVRSAGLTEVLLYGFDHEGERARLHLREHRAGAELPRLRLRNAIASDLRYLRRNIGPNLLACVERNLVLGDGREASRKGFQVGLFEIGRVFVPFELESLSAEAMARVDPGLPPVLASGDDAARETYLGRMPPEMRAGCEQARLDTTPLPWQPMRLGIVLGERLGGGAEGAKHALPPPDVTERLFRTVVGALELVARAAGIGPLEVRRTVLDHDHPGLPTAFPDLGASWLHPQRHGLVRSRSGALLGVISALHPAVRAALDVPAEVVIAELDLPALVEHPGLPVRGLAPAAFPGANQDFTLRRSLGVRVADARAELQAVAESALPGVVEGVEFLYAHAEGAERALTFRVLCRAPDRSVTPDELARLATRVAQDLHGGAGA